MYLEGAGAVLALPASAPAPVPSLAPALGIGKALKSVASLILRCSCSLCSSMRCLLALCRRTLSRLLASKVVAVVLPLLPLEPALFGLLRSEALLLLDTEGAFSVR